MKRIGYVSCAVAKDAAASFGRQRAALDMRALASGVEIDGWVEDAGSGLELREGLDGLLRAVEAGEELEVHVVGIDRLGRGAAVVRSVLARATAANVRIVSDGLVLGKGATAEAHLAVELFLALHETDSHLRSRRARGRG